MFARKTCVLRFSLCFNVVVVVLFVGPHLANRAELEPAPAPASARAAALTAAQMLPPQQQQQQHTPADVRDAGTSGGEGPVASRGPDAGLPPPPLSGVSSSAGGGGGAGGLLPSAAAGTNASGEQATARTLPSEASTHTALTSTHVQQVGGVAAAAEAEEEEDEEGGARTLQEAVPCNDKDAEPRTAQRSDFWVLYNYVRAKRRFRCWESITYTTHADYTFLDNLEPLLDRWRGPVSLAMHAPGTDFKPTLEAIRWARGCMTPLVAELVTFHLFFGTHHVPQEVPQAAKALAGPAPNCSAPPPWTNITSAQMYKTRSHILYPVNVGRNVARESAGTHFVLPSDIELYPSPGTISAFLEMIRRNDPPLRRPAPKVFPLSIFELEKGAALPQNKSHLVSMLKNGSAIPFHKKLCPGCHNVPHSSEWLAANITDGLHVFYIGKRLGYHVHWEPIFIGTNKDPLYDERLSWEGKSDKMTQGYALCVLDYEFHILDNAFLVHKPGIKTLKKDPQRAILSRKTNNLIKKVIFPELKVLYGVRRGCAV